MPYNANTSIVRTNNTFRQGELARKRVHRQGQEGDSALPFWWICYGILPEWSKGADLRSARRLSAWVQTPQVPIVPHFLFFAYDASGRQCGNETFHFSVFCSIFFHRLLQHIVCQRCCGYAGGIVVKFEKCPGICCVIALVCHS